MKPNAQHRELLEEAAKRLMRRNERRYGKTKMNLKDSVFCAYPWSSYPLFKILDQNPHKKVLWLTHDSPYGWGIIHPLRFAIEEFDSAFASVIELEEGKAIIEKKPEKHLTMIQIPDSDFMWITGLEEELCLSSFDMVFFDFQQDFPWKVSERCVEYFYRFIKALRDHGKEVYISFNWPYLPDDFPCMVELKKILASQN